MMIYYKCIVLKYYDVNHMSSDGSQPDLISFFHDKKVC